MMLANIEPFKALIKERCGLRFEGNDAAKLSQAIASRVKKTGIATSGYLNLLRDDASEFQQLVNLLTINETYFFREPEQIALLVEHLAPRLLSLRGEKAPLRILSAGCSSGEEPYSLIMALSEKYGESTRRLFEFHGSDIDSAVLAHARRGRYAEFSFRAFPPAMRDRYFDRDGSHHVIREEIRQQVTFHELNLLAGEFPPALRDFDIVFFRNVSIYFDENTRRSIQQTLAASLKPDGILITGIAETLANDFGILSLVEEKGLFYFSKCKPDVSPKTPPPFTAEARAQSIRTPVFQERVTAPSPRPSTPVSAPVTARPPAALPDIASLRAMVGEHRYEEALPQLENLLAKDARDTRALLLKAYILLERKDFTGAEAATAVVLESDPWSVDALLLLGLAAKWRGQADAAIRHFKRAIYASNECWPAHYYLADLYRNSGAPELARREYRIVLQLLAVEAPNTGICSLTFDLPAGQIRMLCEHQIGRLGGVEAASPAR